MIEPVAEIDGADVGAFPKYALGKLIDVAVDRGAHETDAALPVAVILLHAHHAVVGERLEGDVAVARRALRDPFHRTDRETGGQPAGNLGCPQDAGRIVPNATGIEQSLATAV